MSRFNYFEVVSVADGYFPSTSQVSLDFTPSGITLLNRGSAVVEYSFDGTSVHGDMDPTDESVQAIFNGRNESNIWFRTASGPQDVRVEAWGSGGRRLRPL